jgi:hypothetical protein
VASAFSSASEAKEFLVSRIVSEAELEGLPLSEIERKGLYFSETAWTLPDMKKVNEEFDQNFDQWDYEKKIARLIRNARNRDRQRDTRGAGSWSDAIAVLSKEDHYILVMIKQAGLSTRPPGDFLKLIGTALGLIALIVCVNLIADRLNIDLSRKSMGPYIWMVMAVSVVLCMLLSAILGRQRFNDILGAVVAKAVGRFTRTR